MERKTVGSLLVFLGFPCGPLASKSFTVGLPRQKAFAVEWESRIYANSTTTTPTPTPAAAVCKLLLLASIHRDPERYWPTWYSKLYAAH